MSKFVLGTPSPPRSIGMSNEFVVLSDLHGNYPSLKAVVDAEGSGKEYMILGDIHGLNAYPSKTLELVQEIGNFVLAGNHDKAIFHHGEGHVTSPALSKFELEYTIDNLTEEECEWMRELPFLQVVNRSGSRICLCHAWPYPEKASGYEQGNLGIQKRDVTSVAASVASDYDYVFHGHTHTQYELDCSKFGHDVHFVNPGSLGYDNTYATVDIEQGSVELKEITYETDITEHLDNVLPEDIPYRSELTK